MTIKRIVSIGECMLEFAELKNDQYQLGYAGDTFNMAYYCRNCLQESPIAVEYFTALGEDPFSQKILQFAKMHGIGTRYVRQLAGYLPGLFLLHNDPDSECHFYYYRSQAAARSMLHGEAGDALIKQLQQFDMLYFSGITLAILLPESRQKFYQLLTAAKQQGATLVFDTNYRPKLWSSVQAAADEYKRILPLIDIALPSIEDVRQVFGDEDLIQAVMRFRDHGVREVVVKAGEKGCLLVADEIHELLQLEAVKGVVDTSGAGDSFNGAYLAKRLTGVGMAEAARFAASVAAQVIQYKGAIIPPSAFLK